MAPKGKAHVQDYSQNKRLPARQPFRMHEGASSGVKPSRATSLQGDVPTEVTYSSGDIIIALQEVLARNLQFHNGIYSELPNSIKLILDNLQFGFTRNHRDVFQKTLQALEIHLVNLTAQNEVYASYYANLVLEKTFASEDDLFRKIRLLEAIQITTQILQMISILVNSLAQRISIQRIK